MAGLLGGGNSNGQGNGGLLGGFVQENIDGASQTTNQGISLLNTVDGVTKDLPVVGGITSPLLKTVGGVTDGLPIVSFSSPHLSYQIVVKQ
jgi:hypothetical protein